MSAELISLPPKGVTIAPGSGFTVPAVIADQGEKAAERFFTFFTDTLPNPNTRAAYYCNTMRFFAWTARQGLSLPAIKSYHVSGYLADLAADHSTPTVKQHLASLRMLFDWLITGQIIEANPAAAVRAAKHVVKKGKTPVLKADEARQLLDSIDTASLIGLRDRALIGVMVYSFARVSAALGMRVERITTPKAGGHGSACMRKAASGTRCQPITTRKTTSMRTWRRQALPERKKAHCFALLTDTAS